LDAEGRPFVSDNGNHILDAKFPAIADASDLEKRIDDLPGVVDNGLFVGMADLVLIQSESRFRRISRA
jgi:ribose 5-phosphate isomerase A